MNKFVKLSLALLITSNVFANEMDADLNNVTAEVIAIVENSQVVAPETVVIPTITAEAPAVVVVEVAAPAVTAEVAPVVTVAANGYIANAKTRLANAATSTKDAVINSAHFVKTKTVNGAVATKDFTVARFQKATYINADGTPNKTEVAKTAAAVVAVAAVCYVVYKVCTNNNSSEDDEDEEDFNS